jgi:hypothetical protein
MHKDLPAQAVSESGAVIGIGDRFCWLVLPQGWYWDSRLVLGLGLGLGLGLRLVLGLRFTLGAGLKPSTRVVQ